MFHHFFSSCAIRWKVYLIFFLFFVYFADFVSTHFTKGLVYPMPWFIFVLVFGSAIWAVVTFCWVSFSAFVAYYFGFSFCFLCC